MSVTNVVHTATTTIIPNATYSFKIASYLKVNATYAALWSDTGDELRILNAVATLRFGAGTGLSGSTLVCGGAASCARVNVNGLDIAALRATAAAALASIGVTVVDSRRTRRWTSVGASSAGVGPRGNLQSLEVPTGGFPRQDWSLWIQHQCSEEMVVGGQAHEHYSCSPSGILRKISLDALVEKDAVQGIDIDADQWVRQAHTSPGTTSIEFPVAAVPPGAEAVTGVQWVGIHCTTIAPGFDDPAPPPLVRPPGLSVPSSVDLTAMQCSSSLTCHGDSYSGAPGRQVRISTLCAGRCNPCTLPKPSLGCVLARSYRLTLSRNYTSNSLPLSALAQIAAPKSGSPGRQLPSTAVVSHLSTLTRGFTLRRSTAATATTSATAAQVRRSLAATRSCTIASWPRAPPSAAALGGGLARWLKRPSMRGPTLLIRAWRSAERQHSTRGSGSSLPASAELIPQGDAPRSTKATRHQE